MLGGVIKRLLWKGKRESVNKTRCKKGWKEVKMFGFAHGVSERDRGEEWRSECRRWDAEVMYREQFECGRS